MGVCFDEIFNQAAKFRYMFGGKAETPVVIRCMAGAGFRAAAQHSQMLTPIFTHIPGLKVVFPSNAYDAKGLLIQSIRDNDPVIFFEHKNLYDTKADVPEGLYTIPFAEANVVREGDDATIVTYGQTVQRSLDAAGALAKEGIECEVIDLRTLSPIDLDNGSGERGEHRAARVRGRGEPALLDRGGRLRHGDPGDLRRAQGRGADGDRATHAGAVLPRARGPLHPRRGPDRGRGTPDRRQLRTKRCPEPSRRS